MRILSLDFDGVIHSYTSGWQGPRVIADPPVSGAIDFILKAQQTFDVHIFSSRSRYWFGRWAMKRWLKKHLIEYFWNTIYASVGDPPWTGLDVEEEARFWAWEKLHKIRFPIVKPAAFVSIDDRAITFTGTFPSVEELTAFHPWNKNGNA